MSIKYLYSATNRRSNLRRCKLVDTCLSMLSWQSVKIQNQHGAVTSKSHTTESESSGSESESESRKMRTRVYTAGLDWPLRLQMCIQCTDDWTGSSFRGVDPHGTGGTRLPQYLDWGTWSRMSPPNISRVISATFYPCNILLISWKSF